MFVLWSLERIMPFRRLILSNFAIVGVFTELLVPATWKRGCTIDLIKFINEIAQKNAGNVLIELLNMHSLFMNKMVFCSIYNISRFAFWRLPDISYIL